MKQQKLKCKTPFTFVKEFAKGKYEEYYSDGRIRHDLHDKNFTNKYFPEALQAYTDAICKEQRENCTQKAIWVSFLEHRNWDLVLEAEQPTIDEIIE